MPARAREKFVNLEKFWNSVEECTKCGTCTFWYPVYQEELVESSVARGKRI